MNVVGGTQLGLRKSGGDWQTREIRDISPLQGPELSLNLKLADVPGIVGEEGNVRLDLKLSDDFLMTLSDDRIEQQLVGAFFQQKFAALPDAQRVFELGRIQPGGNPMLQPESFALRTQARRRTQDDTDGAVLAFVRWQGDREGDFPGASSDFRYLLPKDTGHSATVLFDPKRVMLAQLLDTLSGLAANVAFDITRDAEGKPTGAVAKRGRMTVPEQNVRHEFDADTGRGGTKRLVVDMTIFEIPLEMADEFRFYLDEQTLRVEWRLIGTMAVQMRDLDSINGDLKRNLEFFGFDMTEFKERAEDSFEYLLKASYQLEDVEGGQLKNLSFELQEIKAPIPPIGKIKAPSTPPVQPGDPNYAAYLFLTLMMSPLLLGILVAIGAILKAVSEVEIPSVESVLREALEKDFAISPSIRSLVQDTVKLNFGNTILADDQRAPKDIGVFGRISPALTAFVISPLEHTLVAGTSKQFATTPARTGLRWSVEPVLATQSFGQVGTIGESTGLYTAPAAGTFEGPFVRVRVNAVDAAAGFSSSALITVVKSALQINPLAYVTHASGTVNLQAGHLGQPSDLRWTLKDPAQGGRLEGNGATALYTAPAQIPPSDPDDPYDTGAAYLVDEVQLGDAAGTPVQTALLIVESATKLPMTITRVINPTTGTVQLQAVINGKPQDPANTVWSVRYGSGSIDPTTGIYTHDPASRDGFALIGAAFDTGFIGIFEGYVLQTLPPAALEDAVLGVGAFGVQSAEERAAS